jgi:hypothetical protein
MFIHYHFRRRAHSRVFNAAGDKPPLTCTNARKHFQGDSNQFMTFIPGKHDLSGGAGGGEGG